MPSQHSDVSEHFLFSSDQTLRIGLQTHSPQLHSSQTKPSHHSVLEQSPSSGYRYNRTKRVFVSEELPLQHDSSRVALTYHACQTFGAADTSCQSHVNAFITIATFSNLALAFLSVACFAELLPRHASCTYSLQTFFQSIHNAPYVFFTKLEDILSDSFNKLGESRSVRKLAATRVVEYNAEFVVQGTRIALAWSCTSSLSSSHTRPCECGP